METPNNTSETNEGEHQKATDMEMALFFAKHIDDPCVAEVEPGKFKNIREFYVREAKRMLLKFQDPEARQFLESKIKQYED